MIRVALRSVVIVYPRSGVEVTAEQEKRQIRAASLLNSYVAQQGKDFGLHRIVDIRGYR
jgi:uncharacterized protein (UPF0248 family)